MDYLNYENYELKAKLQAGPVKEVGINGCQVDDVIRWARDLISQMNEKFPCRENSLIITKLDEALLWSWARMSDRMKRGVEGLDKP